MYLVIGLTLLLAAIWIGLAFANRLVSPISRLIGAAEASGSRFAPFWTVAVRSGRFVYDKIDQGVIDTLVDETGHGAEGSGGFLRRQQTGKVQAYGAYLFAGAALLAAIFVIAST